MSTIKLNKEEQDILDSFERGEWKSVSNLKAEINKHREYARKTLKKDKRVNIRGYPLRFWRRLQAIAIERRHALPNSHFKRSSSLRYRTSC